jgi:hypothetical protein
MRSSRACVACTYKRRGVEQCRRRVFRTSSSRFCICNAQRETPPLVMRSTFLAGWLPQVLLRPASSTRSYMAPDKGDVCRRDPNGKIKILMGKKNLVWTRIYKLHIKSRPVCFTTTFKLTCSPKKKLLSNSKYDFFSSYTYFLTLWFCPLSIFKIRCFVTVHTTVFSLGKNNTNYYMYLQRDVNVHTLKSSHLTLDPG